ncbi:MAG: phosphatidylinositol-specific phospholipase C1-like protein, partial [Phycisphaerae bacterium]|nr:phosphatidylinositol-specific phospholipase C1-like protein [Phycisphaerae bacterium]
AFRIVNDPIKETVYIRQLVEKGYLVRTRADADTQEARRGETARREAAFASGAHVISTDYYRPDPRFNTGYHVTLPGGGAARWNPLSKDSPDVPPSE